MKKFALFALATMTLGLFSCENPDLETPEEQPRVELELKATGNNSVTFEVETENAKSARYMVLGNEENAPTLETILAEGVEITLNEDGEAVVVAEGLQPETSYKVVAAVKNVNKTAGSNTLYVTTLSLADLVVSAEIVQVDHEKMNFRVTSTNAEKISYVVMLASKETPSVSYVLLNGEPVEVGTKESIEVTGLECSSAYKLVIAAEGAGQTTMAEPIPFNTLDDPNLVISHEYTRARGMKYGSSCYMMFSYEDANEADNFAYNEKTLCLDFYTDADRNYLTEGTYVVKEANDPGCISSLRYSTYGYDNGVLLKSGEAVVTIDPETKAYTFDIDLFLKDGRHLKATYTGDVDGMPVVDIITVNAKFNTASATTADNGKNWTLNFADADGNSASFNLCNAFQTSYIVNNVYVINTSTESEEVNPDVVAPGQFDAATSTFTVAGQEPTQFLTGTLTVDINWDEQKYMVTFYGSLDGNYVIEADYQGSIEGVSLAPSDDVIDVMLTSATARAYESNTNWYIEFAKTDNGVEKYRLVLDAFCPASEYLPAGYYKLNVSDEGRYLGSDATSLRVAGEGQYSALDAGASVTIDMEKKTYTFDISFKVQDGRTFKLAYVGEVEGMPIVETQEVPDDIAWTTFVAKKWYSDNWNLSVKSADAAYAMDFDLRTGDSSANYITSGVYTLGEEGQYIDGNYSKFNGNSKAYKEATLNVTYNEADKTYDISFDVILHDGRNFTGAYSGAVEGSPAE
ncbi:MAG: hypothetical protein IKY75_01610 [Bacteroidaceae bacterium]|nr:hypothetical protein [Bacteroidaceae bacterium]